MSSIRKIKGHQKNNRNMFREDAGRRKDQEKIFQALNKDGKEKKRENELN